MKIGPNIEINKDKLPEPVKAGDVKMLVQDHDMY